MDAIMTADDAYRIYETRHEYGARPGASVVTTIMATVGAAVAIGLVIPTVVLRAKDAELQGIVDAVRGIAENIGNGDHADRGALYRRLVSIVGERGAADTGETTPTPEEDQACMGAWRVVKLLENAKGIRRNVGIAEALDQARLNLAALAQRTGWRQPE